MADSRGRAPAAVLDEGPKGGPPGVPVLDEGPIGGPPREWLACRQLSWRFRRGSPQGSVGPTGAQGPVGVLDPWTSFRPFPPRGVEGEARMKLSVIRFHVGDG